jgi:putative hemolysin
MGGRIALILAAILMVALAGLFSGAETGIYRLSRLRLRLGIQKRRWSSLMLARIMHDSPGLVFTTLIGTNLGNYLITSIVTYLFLDVLKSEHSAELFTTAVTAPVLFVFSELIPKNMFLRRADVLTPLFAPFLFVSHKLFSVCGAVPFLKLVSNAIGRLTGAQVLSKTAMVSSHRHQVRAILEDTREEGILSAVQADIMNRIVNVPGLHIRVVMIPLNKVQTVDINSNRDVLLAKLRKTAFTRLLVTKNGVESVVGFINIYEALSSPDDFDDLSRFVRPIRKLEASTHVTDAINIMQSESQRIVLVTRIGRGKRERPIGVVTMKDLVEELVGELAEW